MLRIDLSIPFLALLIVACGCSPAERGRLAAATSQPSATRWVVTDFGAVGDGAALNTASIQATIDHAAAVGGGTVVIPQGIFLSGAIFLKPSVDLQLEKNAVLKGSSNVSDYPKSMTRIEGHFQPWLPALLNAEKCDHLRIGGIGTLDGNGQPFWAEFHRRVVADRKTTNLDVERPRLIFIRDSRDVQIRDVHLKDSGFWNLHLYRCQDVLVDGLDIQAGERSPSTDGVDIDSSQNITIHGCRFAVNDDCIALKGSKGPFALQDADSPPVEHIRISDCTVMRGESIVTCGSEATVVRDVVAEGCTTLGTTSRGFSVLRLKLRPDTPQTYEDIHIVNAKVEGIGSVIQIARWTQYFDLKGQPAPAGMVRNVTLSGITGSCSSLGSIRGNTGSVIEKVSIENVDLKTTAGKPDPSTANNLVLKNVTINGEAYTNP